MNNTCRNIIIGRMNVVCTYLPFSIWLMRVVLIHDNKLSLYAQSLFVNLRLFVLKILRISWLNGVEHKYKTFSNTT